MIELNVAIVCSCAPALKHFFRQPLSLASSLLSRSGGKEISSGSKKTAPESNGVAEAGEGGGGKDDPHRRPGDYLGIEEHELITGWSTVMHIGEKVP